MEGEERGGARMQTSLRSAALTHSEAGQESALDKGALDI